MSANHHEKVAPDIETASDGYAQRFSREVGQWFLEKQISGIQTLLKPLGRCHILEVGGGHTQITGFLVASGHRVVVQGSAPCCAERVRRLYSPDTIPFVCSNLDQLPFNDREFDAVITVRTMAHVEDPEKFLAECGRIARDAVLIDFPSLRSLNVLGDLLFGLKHKVERDTRSYRSFAPSEIYSMLSSSGFRVYDLFPQFFWPMALHRLHGSRKVSRLLEAIPDLTGFTRILGSPILVLYRR